MDSITLPLGIQHTYTPLIQKPHAHYAAASASVPSLGYYVPDEITFEILSYFIPKHGVTISTDSGSNICHRTINSLLRTSRTIRNEVISYTKRFPLHIYIASGKNCQCYTLKTPDDILEAPLGKAALLPIGIWSEIFVTFAPALGGELDDACMKIQRALINVDVPYSTFDVRSRCRAAIRCVQRQSSALSRTMEYLAKPREGDNIRWRFVFDGSRGIDARDEQHRRPLWSLGSIAACLTRWRWHAGAQTVPAIRLPKRFYVGVNRVQVSLNHYDTDGWAWTPEAEEVCRQRQLEGEFQSWWRAPGTKIWGPNASERDLEGLYPAHYWYDGPLPAEPVVVNNMEIREVLGPFARNSPIRPAWCTTPRSEDEWRLAKGIQCPEHPEM